jgi:hypothetical protein
MYMTAIGFIKHAAIALIIGAVALAGCKKDDDGNTSPVTDNRITASVVNGASLNGYIDNVMAFGYDMGIGKYAGGGFTVTLVAAVHPQNLNPVDYLFEYLYMFKDVKVSDPDAMAGEVKSFQAWKSSNRVGNFYHRNYDPSGEAPASGASASYLYVDRDVSVTGGVSSKEDGRSYTGSVNMFLKRGWNLIYYTRDYNETAGTATEALRTGAAPAGMKWYFVPSGSFPAKAALPGAAGLKALPGRLE